MIRTQSLIGCHHLSVIGYKRFKMPHYAVAIGKNPGIYSTWEECQQNTLGCPGSKFKKFNSEIQAQLWIEENQLSSMKRKVSDSSGEDAEKQKKSKVSSTCVRDSEQSSSASSNHMFDFASFAQRLTNLENMYQEKIRTLEERVEALEATKFFGDKISALEKSTSVGEPVKKSVPTESASCNSLSNSLRNRLCKAISNPVALGSHRAYSTVKGTKRSVSVEEVDSDVLPSKVPAVDSIHTQFTVPFRTDSEDHVQVYTDGACTNNGKVNPKAGVGVWFGDNHPLNVSEPVKGRATNNVAEIQAAIRAVEQAASAGVRKLCVITDSMFMIQCMTSWVSKWRKNNWKTATGEPVKNKPELIELDRVLQMYGVAVKWSHVPGHHGIHGNEQADALARQGALLYKAVKIPTLS